MVTLISLAVALLAGLLMSRLAKYAKLPAVTAYLIAGALIGPFCLGRLSIPGLGFASLEAVDSFGLISDVALGFIAFAIGNEFRLGQLKKTGKQATVIGILQAVFTSALVAAVLIGLHFIIPDKLPLGAAITLAAIAAATAPAATLMVVRQYKAKGPVTDILLPVVALDDAVGLIIFAVCFGIAKSLYSGAIDIVSIIVEPILEVVLSLLLGALMGVLFTFTERFFQSRSKRLAISVTYVILTVGISMAKFEIGGVHIGFSVLLVCMMLGTMFCNMCDVSEELMDRTDRWTAPLFVLFFVFNGASLDFTVFSDFAIVGIGVVYIIVRCIGKYIGARVSAKWVNCDKMIVDYLGIALFPQAGVALGMTVTALSLGNDGILIRNIVLFAVLVYEIVGPLLTKIALTKAGEITPGATNARGAKKV